MKNIYAVENSEQLKRYQKFVRDHGSVILEYRSFLEKQYAVRNLPSAVLWTSREIATKDLSSIPIPAYTNDYRTVFCPELEVWKKIYLHQLDEWDDPKIRRYYKEQLTENHILQILGHEFVHHSDYFPENTRESNIWFEEGMCEYISRKYFLTDEQFQEEARINALLVKLHQEKYGEHPLETFGAAAYDGSYASIFYEYWRSFLTVNKLIDDAGGDVVRVLREYQKKYQGGD